MPFSPYLTSMAELQNVGDSLWSPHLLGECLGHASAVQVGPDLSCQRHVKQALQMLPWWWWCYFASTVHFCIHFSTHKTRSGCGKTVLIILFKASVYKRMLKGLGDISKIHCHIFYKKMSQTHSVTNDLVLLLCVKAAKEHILLYNHNYYF